MTNNEILRADLLDILFEHRNKAYGAYALRKNYNNRLQWALGICLLLVLLCSMIKIRKADLENGMYTRRDVTLQTIDVPKSKSKNQEPIHQKKISPVAQVKSTRITIVPNDQVKQPEVPTVKDLQNAVTSTINQAGDIPNGLAQPSKASSEGENGTGKKEHDEVDFHPSSTDAQFPGGAEGFKKFMTRYLVTPDELEIGERKTVLVRFEVDADGSISNTEIMQTGGDRFDKEVLRVLSKMPKWIPATQNGVKVATWFTQPVTFIGVEQ